MPDHAAQGGSTFAVFDSYEQACGCPAGVYALVGRLRGEGTRAWLTVDGRRVGEWTLSSSYRELQAVVAIAGPATAVGVQVVGGQRDDALGPAFLDWLRVTAVPAQYTTLGRDVLGPDRLPTVLRGVTKAGFEYNPLGATHVNEDLPALRSWGVGAVRLLASQEFTEPTSCRYDPGYLDRVVATVQLLTAEGFYVVIDNHHSQAGEPCRTGIIDTMADEFAVGYWLKVANRLKHDAMVGFDLYNEPHDVSWEVWRDGGDAGGFHTPGMQALYDTVRATGATNLVFVTGPSWGNDLRPVLEMPLDGSGIVYSGHAYCYSCQKDRSGAPRYMEDWMAAAVAEYPVVLLEFGAPAWDSGAHIRAVLDWVDRHGIGWSAYSWSNATPGEPFGLLAPVGTYQPSTNGRPVRAALRAAG